jgi:HicA toxin of bacterial toxin-antitoxin,
VGQRDLPLASGSAHIKAFERAGWICAKRKAKDAHFILHKEGQRACLSIPDHKQVKRALLQKQIKLAGLTEAEYVALFRA